MKTRLGGAIVGVLFGFVLSWAQVTDPKVIESMLLLREPDVFLLMGSAIAVSSVGIWLLRLRGARALSSGEPITWERTRPEARHVIGSVMFGIGWGVAKSCPGPVTAMIGQGKPAGLCIGGGLLLGVWLYRSYELARADVHAPSPSAGACATP